MNTNKLEADTNNQADQVNPEPSKVISHDIEATTVQPITTENSGSNPAPVTSQNQPSNIAANSTVLTQSQALALEKKNHHILKKVLLALGAISVLFVVLVILQILGIISLGRFKTIDYDNGKGAKFNLSFYSKYKLEDSLPFDYTGTNPTMQPNQSGSKSLVSKTSIDNKAPLRLLISKGVYNQALIDKYQNCTTALPKALSVHNKNFNKDISLCALKVNGSAILYVAITNDDKHVYIIVVTQDIDLKKANESQANAQAALEKVDLQVYNDDLQTILGSFKPIE